MPRLYSKILLTLFFSIFIFNCFAKDMKVESLTERTEDLTANTYVVMDLNNNKCALIKLSIPDKAAFEGNVVKSEYKVNEYYIYLSPGTKKLAVKYPGVETLEIDLSDFLDGSGVVSGRTYRLKLSGVPEEIPQLTILMPENNLNGSQYISADSLQALYFYNNPVVKEPEKVRFIIRPNVSIGLGNALNIQSDVSLSSHKASSISYGVDFGYNLWGDTKNSISVNLGIGYSSMSLNLEASDLSFNYSAPAQADMDGNTYIRYYDITGFKEEIKTNLIAIPIYFGYTYNITKWLGVYLNLGATLGIKSGSTLNSVNGDASVYGIYRQYGDLKIEESYLNNFGSHKLNNAEKGEVNVNGFSSSLLLGFGFDLKIYGPIWFNAGIRYNLGLGNIYSHTYDTSGSFTSANAPVTYTVANGENVKSLTDYFSKSSLSSLALNLGLSIKF